MSAEVFEQDPIYLVAAQHFQKGEWKEGLMQVERLIQLFPGEPELRSLRNELLFKERLDSMVVGDLAVEKRLKLRRLLLSVALAASALSVVAMAIRTYSGWIGEQLTAAGQQVQYEVQLGLLVAKRQDARALIQVGRLDEAQAIVDEIAALDPVFPGLADLRSELATERGLAALYNLAVQQIDSADWLGARASLEQLAAQEPHYRDIDIQMMYIERQTLLGNLLNEGEAAMARGNWEQAVAAFESMRTLHPRHEPEYVEARLFESYVSAARAVLVGQEDSLVALAKAEVYLRKALTLRPQDADIKHERELAGLYLKAQNEFDQGIWSSVIAALEPVMEAVPGYAQGTARQTLYDAYVARGEDQMAAHLYEMALSDFEGAVALAQQDERAALRLYEGELRLAEARGAIGDFEAAVVHYRAAVEWGNLVARSADKPALLGTLQEAEAYAAQGNFAVAYERYQRAVRLADSHQVTVEHEVQPGEYLTLLASRYRSTVSAIVGANAIENKNLIFPGERLIIPVLP